jgi:hypothetical protein
MRLRLRAADLRRMHRREEDGPRLHADWWTRADRATRERIVARPSCSAAVLLFRQLLARRLPPGDGLCWFCVDKQPPESDAERVDRRIAVQRMVRTAMRSIRKRRSFAFGHRRAPATGSDRGYWADAPCSIMHWTLTARAGQPNGSLTTE